jgi:hypothetical protein
MDFMQEEVKPKWRSGVGMALILLLIAAWALGVLLLSPLVRQLPFLLEALFYAAAGICWIFPVRPLLVWMSK